jgi:hypothetical protein
MKDLSFRRTKFNARNKSLLIVTAESDVRWMITSLNKRVRQRAMQQRDYNRDNVKYHLRGRILCNIEFQQDARAGVGKVH